MTTSKAVLIEKIDAARTRYYYRNKAEAEELATDHGLFLVVVTDQEGLYIVDLCKPSIIWWNP